MEASSAMPSSTVSSMLDQHRRRVIGQQISEHNDEHMGPSAIGLSDKNATHLQQGCFHRAKSEFDIGQPFITGVDGIG